MRAAVRAGADAVYFGLRRASTRAPARRTSTRPSSPTRCASSTHGRERLRHAQHARLRRGAAVASRPPCAPAPRPGSTRSSCRTWASRSSCGRVAPSLPIHASTQMTCTDAAGVELARAVGATRVILARELSLDDIAADPRADPTPSSRFRPRRALHRVLRPVPDERGHRRAQREPRRVRAGVPACPTSWSSTAPCAISATVRTCCRPRTSRRARSCPSCELGVSSLKIEGRLKGPEYVAATTALYRAASTATADRAHAGRAARRAADVLARLGPGVPRRASITSGSSTGARATTAGLPIGDGGGRSARAGQEWIALHADDGRAQGDGLLVEGGWAGEGEVGGRVWEVVEGEVRGRARRRDAR